MFSALARKQKQTEVAVEKEPKKARHEPQVQSKAKHDPEELSDNELIQLDSDLESFDKEEEEYDLKKWLLTIDTDTPGEGEVTDPHPIKVNNHISELISKC